MRRIKVQFQPTLAQKNRSGEEASTVSASRRRFPLSLSSLLAPVPSQQCFSSSKQRTLSSIQQATRPSDDTLQMALVLGISKLRIVQISIGDAAPTDLARTTHLRHLQLDRQSLLQLIHPLRRRCREHVLRSQPQLNSISSRPPRSNDSRNVSLSCRIVQQF